MKCLVIAGTGSGVGKTTVTIGIMAALKAKGLKVQPFKVGPDYVDTAYQTRVTGIPSRNLDSFLIQDESVLKQLFTQQVEKADIGVVEGVMGLFDGLGTDKDNCSTSSVAKQLDAPVILVIDGKATSTSAAAMVKGFAEFDADLNVAGVILNRIASDTHFELVKKSIERYTTVPVLGYLPKNLSFHLPSRQLGLVPELEMADLSQEMAELVAVVNETIDLDRLVKLSTNSEGEESSSATVAPFYELIEQPIRLAYAYDEAFNFYYQDNLEVLEAKGVTLVPFSPIRDIVLPEADFYYFGGGYPEEYGKELMENRSLRQAILAKHQEGLPIYAECGGLMYLGEFLECEGDLYEMVGIFQGTSKMTSGLKRFGYCQGEVLVDTPICPEGTILYGHEFHHSIFETKEQPVMKMSKYRDGEEVAKWSGGYLKKQTFASYLHLHFFQDPLILTWLLGKAAESLEKR